MKFLVMGATGMAGHIIAIYLQEQGHDVTTFSNTPFKYCKNVIGDALDIDVIKRTILNGKYDIVINCIGILNQAAVEHKANAVFLNSYLPHFICQIIQDTSTRLIHMSTDCVFSGKTGSYHENSFRDGESFYDRSKALGEIEDSRNLTFRNSIIGPDMNINGIGLFNWFMRQHGEISGYTRAIWTGVTTLTLAKAMQKAAITQLTGIYNLVNNSTINKYDLLNLFNKHFRAEELIIKPSEQVVANKSLINQRQDFDFIVPSYEEMVIEMREWVDTHKQLYPHYVN